MRRGKSAVEGTGAASPGTGAGGTSGGARSFRVMYPLLAGLLTAVVTLAAVTGYLIVQHQRQDAGSLPLPTGIPASVPSSLAIAMQLSPLPAQPAPGFTLTDQDGRQVSLASLRGRAVVLDFMDPHCTDICPIVSEEFLAAYRDLGPAAKRVAFVAVNVNPYYRRVADVAGFSAAHGLTAIRSWYFLTGPLAALKTVWGDYQIEVLAPSRTGDIIHSSLLYFIDPSGRERFVAAPMVNHTAAGNAFLPAAGQAAWGRGIALVTRSLTG